MNKILKNTIIATLVAVFAAGAFWLGFGISRWTLQGELNDINFIIEMYRKYYYDEKDDVVGIFADSLLDAYSSYYTKEQYDLIKKADYGAKEGVGISYNGTKITRVNGNSPAKRAGLKAGGSIKALGEKGNLVYVNNESEFEKALDAIPAYTDFDMIVDYDGEERQYTLQKQEYVQTYVSYADATGEYGFSDESGSMKFIRYGDSTLTGDVAYIKYDGFNGIGSGLSGSVGQFEKAMQTYKANGMRNVILDLRRNGGGFLYIGQNICRYFVDEREDTRPVVSVVRDKYGNEEKYYADPIRYGEFDFDNIIILADVYTASASEMFIGAVLDYDKQNKVKVILDVYRYYDYETYRTYGKGIMQTTYERVGGGAIKLTTAKLFWPISGVTIHDVGITTELNSIYGGRIINASDKGAYEDALSLCQNTSSGE